MALNFNSLVNLAVDIGLDQKNTFSQCLADGSHRADVETARQAAANRGVSSTPTFFINSRRVTGNVPFQQFQNIINQELAVAQ
jgi:protein-disulfide isomerase